MNTFLSRLALGALMAILFFGGAAAAHADAEDYTPGEIVVKLFQAGDLETIAGEYGLSATPLAQFGTRPIYRLQILDGALPPDKAAALAGDGRVEFAEPNFEAYAPESQQRSGWAIGASGAFGEQWADEKIRLDAAHRVTRGAGVTVAVLDTGIDAQHPAFAGKLTAGYDFVDMDADPAEVGVVGQDAAFGHGTHVAGLVTFVAPEAKIMPVRVLDRNGVGNIWVLAEALAFAADPDGNPATDDGADVINLSLSTRRATNLLHGLIAELTCSEDDDDDDCAYNNERGIVLVAAAGNSASEIPEYPAAEGVEGALAVAASNSQDTLAWFSNYGGWVHILAPGEQMTSAVPGGVYATWDGTSMAAPLAAGQAALVRAKYPRRAAAWVVNRILDTADAVETIVPKRIDVGASVGQP